MMKETKILQKIKLDKKKNISQCKIIQNDENTAALLVRE